MVSTRLRAVQGRPVACCPARSALCRNSPSMILPLFSCARAFTAATHRSTSSPCVPVSDTPCVSCSWSDTCVHGAVDRGAGPQSRWLLRLLRRRVVSARTDSAHAQPARTSTPPPAPARPFRLRQDCGRSALWPVCMCRSRLLYFKTGACFCSRSSATFLPCCAITHKQARTVPFESGTLRYRRNLPCN